MNKFFQRQGRGIKRALAALLSAYLAFQPLALAAQESSANTKIEGTAAGGPVQQNLLFGPTSLEGSINPGQYVLGPSDELILIIRGAENKVINLKVLPEGSVVLPNIGSYPAAGMTLNAFKSRLIESLSRFYKNVDIDCQLTIPRTFLVYVLGEVKNPGAVELYAPFRLSVALQRAGGVTENGSLREIEIREKDNIVRKVDLFSFLHLGYTKENLVMREGQALYVPPKKSIAQSIGELHEPGRYEILEGDRIRDLITFSGGFSSRADTSNMVFERFKDGELVSAQTLPFFKCKNLPLMDQDILIVPDIMSFTGRQYVQVMGGGGRKGVFYINPGEKLKDFLIRIGRFNEQYDLSKAVLERHVENGKSRYFYLDLKAIIEGNASSDIVLKDQDIISIPRVEDKVYVIGEVVEPGEFMFMPGIPAERYISMSGGPKDSGSINKLSIISTNGEQREGDQNSMVYRGETIVVKKKTTRILGSLILGVASLTGLMLSIVAITR